MSEPDQTNPTFSDHASDDKDRQQRAREVGRVYQLVCLGCRSRLEVMAGLAGQACKCPTCGIGFVVPGMVTLRGARGQAVPVGEVLEERIAPHAYAAAGEMAPEVIEDDSGKAMIRCRRCGTMNPIEVGACRSCGIPFTIEAGTVEPAWPVNGWAVASVVFGVLSLGLALVGSYFPGSAVGAIVSGLVALRRLKVHYGGLQRVSAWSGIVLGGLSTAAYVIDVIRHD